VGRISLTSLKSQLSLLPSPQWVADGRLFHISFTYETIEKYHSAKVYQIKNLCTIFVVEKQPRINN
ncbi:MAG: hypothetical protein IIV29_04335, partial [Tidjanibacter sp.]|nr:hypothetical protein [Tidjanibacter sp.]